jgi:hypothetical protein
MSFQDATRRKCIPLGTQSSAALVNPMNWDLPKVGLLAAIHLRITCVDTGAPAAANIYGICSAIRRVRLITNSGIDLINITGPGYFYLLQNMLEGYQSVTPQNQGGTVPSAATFNLDMVLPIAINARDPVGLFMLQNEQTLVQLQVEIESDTVIGGGVATFVTTVQPCIEVFTVPVDPKDWPALNVVQQILEDVRPIASVGDYDYSWPRGNTYIQVAHGYGTLTTAVDHWTRAQLIVNQSETIYDFVPLTMAVEWNRSHGRVRGLGVILFDLMGTSGLGTFGSSRDLLYSALVTELTSRITIGAQPHVLRTVRRQLIALR